MRPALLAALLLAGCTPMQWMREGEAPAPDALEKDSSECRLQAWREAQYRSWAYAPVGPIAMRDPFGRRFIGWPYRPYAYPFGDPFFEEARMMDFCMRAKGYELVPAQKKGESAQKPPG